MAKSIKWRYGGKVDIKTGDTSKIDTDFNYLSELKECYTPIIEEHVCQKCGGALKGSYFVNYIACNLFNLEQVKGIFGGLKTKYILRETVYRVNGWGVENVKCHGCKTTWLSQDMIHKQEAKEQAKEEARLRKENFVIGANDKAVCPDCDNVLGTRGNYRSPCPRCGYAGTPKFLDQLFGIEI